VKVKDWILSDKKQVYIQITFDERKQKAIEIKDK
jgi:hypothetical protein